MHDTSLISVDYGGGQDRRGKKKKKKKQREESGQRAGPNSKEGKCCFGVKMDGNQGTK